MDAQAILNALKDVVPDGAVTAAVAADGMPTLRVAAEHVVEVCRELRDQPALRFAFMADMTVVDNMPREPRFEIVLHVASFGVEGFGDTAKRLRVKVLLPGTNPSMPTLSGIWKSANWAEREVWDMFGIHIEGHPDLRRILMPDDWDGHPGRKDYPVQIRMTPKVYEALQVSPEQFVASVQAARDRAKQE